ncbi:MAG: glycosyltransferase family 4 protein [Planctomycetota bacterium]
MRCLLLTDSDAFAGTERHMLDLAGALASRGVDASIGNPAGTPLAERAHAAGLPHLDVPRGPAVDLPAARQLAGLLKRGDLDLIHAHNGRAMLIGAVATRLAGRGALVATQHFLTPSRSARRGPKAWLANALHRWVAGRVDRQVAISSAVLDAMIARGDAPADRCRLVRNGIPSPQLPAGFEAAATRREFGLTPDAPLVVTAARLVPEKSIGVLIDAMRRVVERIPEAVCLIAGTGSLEGELSRRIDNAGLVDRVRLLGFRRDVHALIAAGDVFALPSAAEPFGLVLLEAMALGRPVVATDHGGPRDIVTPDTGRLVTADDPDAMGDALATLLADRSSADASGRAGRDRYRAEFTVDRMADEMLAVYREVCPIDAAIGKADPTQPTPMARSTGGAVSCAS